VPSASKPSMSIFSIAGQIIAVAVGVAFGRYAGINFVIPAILVGLAALLFSRTLPVRRRIALPSLAIQTGHMCWMALAVVLVPGGLSQVGLDIAILAVLLLWLAISGGLIPAVLLIIYQLLSLAVNGGVAMQAGLASPKMAPLSVHMALRVLAILALIGFIAARGRPKPKTEPAVLNTVD